MLIYFTVFSSVSQHYSNEALASPRCQSPLASPSLSRSFLPVPKSL